MCRKGEPWRMGEEVGWEIIKEEEGNFDRRKEGPKNFSRGPPPKKTKQERSQDCKRDNGCRCQRGSYLVEKKAALKLVVRKEESGRKGRERKKITSYFRLQNAGTGKGPATRKKKRKSKMYGRAGDLKLSSLRSG